MEPGDLISTVKGVGAKSAGSLKRLGIITVDDMLRHYPVNYIRYQEPVSVSDTSRDDLKAAAYHVLVPKEPTMSSRGRLSVCSLTLSEYGKRLQAVWYNSPYIRQQLKAGMEVILYGKVVIKKNRRVLEHPEIFTPEKYAEKLRSLQPVYGLTGGITRNFMIRTINSILSDLDMRKDPLPCGIRKEYHLAEYNFALNQIHFPDDEDAYLLARKRLVFDEFFDFILSVKMLKKRERVSENKYPVYAAAEIVDFIESLPFRLTAAQLRVVDEIMDDMAGSTAMNRLVQGDVGSGKTVVAAIAMFAAARSGYQSCMMAPTEVLARQHFENLTHMMEPSGIRTVLLTGSLKAAEKRKIYNSILNHEADIIVGTQAVFQEKVDFYDLGLIITDEQHRFGVNQRKMLADKSRESAPHVLVMSATPIPRTLAIILYGDLDISIIDEKPVGRLPIKNCVVDENYRPTAYRFIHEQIRKGNQVYIICPMVEESESMDAENVVDYSAKLRTIFPENIRIEYLHGRMKAKEKEDIMQRFSSHDIDILVSTTVIEVGVDVPSATVMMIENSERFGLAQLHQLRGRVGRGKDQSYCIFMYGKEGEKVKERLDVMQTTNDGFVIAKEDMKQRGPGDMFGIRQSGDLGFSIADVYSDSDILIDASKAADDILSRDPMLTDPENEELKKRIRIGLYDGDTIL